MTVNLESQSVSLVKEGRWEDLADLLSAHAQAVEQDTSLAFYLGFANLNLGRADEAIKYLRLATEGKETVIQHEGALGRALLMADEAAEAEAVARRALSVSDTVLLRSILGMALRRQGKGKEAGLVYDEGLIAHPSNSEMLRVIGDFLSDTMRGDEAQEVYAHADRLDDQQ